MGLQHAATYSEFHWSLTKDTATNLQPAKTAAWVDCGKYNNHYATRGGG
jgi:hypothetical protein